MNTYTAKQQQFDKLKREEKRFINDINVIGRALQIDTLEYVKSYEKFDDVQKDLVDKIETLRIEYNAYEDKKQAIKRDILEDNNIDIVKFILQSNNPQFEVEEFYKLGVISSDQWEYVKDYLWKNRQSMKYKLQTSYYQDDKSKI